MKNNKGFTLIELLAVVLILATISLVAVVGIMSSLEKRGTKECEEQMALAKNAAKLYFSIKGGTSVTVNTLKTGGYFTETSKTDRLKNFTITMSSSGYSMPTTTSAACN